MTARDAILRYLDCDRDWYSFESELGGNLLQVYDITPERVRMDSTTASSYCGVNPKGLFQWGHSKDHRPDLAQVKIMLSTNLSFKITEDAVKQKIKLLGWRVYVTKRTEFQLSLKQAVRAYRDEYLTERGFAIQLSTENSRFPLHWSSQCINHRCLEPGTVGSFSGTEKQSQNILEK